MNRSAPRARPAAFRSSTLAGAACLAIAGHAWAQEAPETTQRVEITGSRIKQIDAEGVSPVQVFNRQDIQASGASNVREMLESISATNTGGQGATLTDLNGSNSFAGGASGVALRNLGKQSTLVLLNGRRIAPYPLADYSEIFSNIDSLPLEAIERIEILKSGGAAIYGSDAVAGVINIITRPGYRGAQLDYSFQRSLRNKLAAERTGALTVGIGDYDKDGWNIFGNLEMYRRDEAMWDGKVLRDVNPDYAHHSSVFGTGSSYSYPGNVIGVGPVPGCQGTLNASGSLCLYDRYSRFEAVPEAQRINGLLSMRRRVDDRHEVYAEALVSNTRTTYQDPYQTYGESLSPLIWGDPSTGATKTFYYRGLPAGHPLNPTGDEVEFRYRFVDGPSYTAVQTNQYRFLAGLKGTTEKADWDSAIGIMGGSTHMNERGWYSDSGFKQVIGDYGQPDVNGQLPPLPPDFFDKPGGYRIGQPNSQAVLDTLFPVYGYTGTTQQYFWDGTLRIDLAQMPAGALQLATGFDLRHEQMTIAPSAQLATGDIVGNGVSESDASRNFGAVFAELGIPLTKTLDGDLAARLDKYPHFGAHLSPKAGLRFKPVDSVLLRGTYETGFRAPNLSESAPSLKFAFDPNIDDPKRCPQATAYANDLSALGDAATDPTQAAIFYSRAQSVFENECGRSVADRTVNNPGLKPETSRSFTLGTVLQATQRWSATIDYWNISRKNEIETRAVQDMLSAEATQPPGELVRAPSFANDPTFSHDPTGLTDAQVRAKYGVVDGDYYLQSVNNTFLNLSRTRTDGVDVGLKGSVPLGFGEFGMGVDASYTHSYRVVNLGTGHFGDNLAGRYGFPKWVVNTTGTLTTGPFQQTLRYVYKSRTALKLDFDDTNWDAAGCADKGLQPWECHVQTYNRFDYTVEYSGIKGFTLGLYIRNVLNRRPPADFRSFGAPTGVIPIDADDAAGRTGKVMISYKWL